MPVSNEHFIEQFNEAFDLVADDVVDWYMLGDLAVSALELKNPPVLASLLHNAVVKEDERLLRLALWPPPSMWTVDFPYGQTFDPRNDPNDWSKPDALFTVLSNVEYGDLFRSFRFSRWWNSPFGRGFGRVPRYKFDLIWHQSFEERPIAWLKRIPHLDLHDKDITWWRTSFGSAALETNGDVFFSPITDIWRIEVIPYLTEVWLHEDTMQGLYEFVKHVFSTETA
jgi:hypothetical protein